MYTSSYFSIKVEVFNNTGISLESTRGPHSISLSVSPGTLNPATSGDTTNGYITFTNLQITSAGNQTLTATCSDMVESSISFYIAALKLDSMKITNYPNSSPAFTLFSLTVELFDQTLTTWTSQTSVSLTGNLNINGDLSANINGNYTFKIYSEQIGTLEITVTAGSLTMLIQLNITIDFLKIESISTTVFFI